MQRSVDIRFADRAVATQLFENLLQLIAEFWKHKLLRNSKAGSSRPLLDDKFRRRSRDYLASRDGAPDPPYFFGVGAAAPAAPSSIPNVQCASTFFPSDFAVRITVQLVSRSFCVT